MAIKTFTTGEVLTAADTNTYLANSGLVYVAGATFSGVTSAAPLDVNSVFTSTYKNYCLILRQSQTVANSGGLMLRMRTVAAQEATAVYNFVTGGGFVSAAPSYFWTTYSFSNPFSPSTSFFTGLDAGNTYEARGKIDILSPQEALSTNIIGQAMTQYTGSNYHASVQLGGFMSNTTQYTGFRIYPTSGTASGEYALYGYRVA
jgi:hypothetical protein